MKVMQIFEPAMCCSTGVCGVSVDPELLRISTVLNTLKKHGVNVDRFNLSSAPQEFVTNKVANQFVIEQGVDQLPLVLVDNEIVISGRYPTNEEFVKYLDIPRSYLGLSARARVIPRRTNKSGGCGCSGGNCC